MPGTMPDSGDPEMNCVAITGNCWDRGAGEGVEEERKRKGGKKGERERSNL